MGDGSAPTPRPSRIVAPVISTAALVTAFLVLSLEVWRGPTLFSLSSSHGIDAGDLIVLPLVALAIGVWTIRPPGNQGEQSSRRRKWRTAGPLFTIAFGMLLVVIGPAMLRQSVLIPAGGGTLDGDVRFAGPGKGIPAEVWTNVAVTYDGRILQVYVNGVEVSRLGATGTIQDSSDPLWIGGNRPYGEFFEGLIDELRVYDTALSAEQIAGDMTVAVADGVGSGPNQGPVAAYGFDDGSSVEVADYSGNGNSGEIIGATSTTHARFGRALRFDGVDDMVRVPARPSLDLGSEMTLSAWVWPSTEQVGWRTIVQRQADAYFVSAGSSLSGDVGRFDDAVAAIAVATAVCFGLALTIDRGRWLGPRHGRWRAACGLFLIGCVVDVAFAPSGTVFGPLMLAGWFASTSTRREEAVLGWLVTGVLAVVTVIAIGDLSPIADRLALGGGANTRTAVFGGLLVVVGLLRLPRRWSVFDGPLADTCGADE